MAWIAGLLSVDHLGWYGLIGLLTLAAVATGCIAWLRAAPTTCPTRIRRHDAKMRAAATLAVVAALSAGWQWERGPGRTGPHLDTVLRDVADPAQPKRLLRVRGEVVDAPRWPAARNDPFAVYDFGKPSLTFDLRVRRVEAGGAWLDVAPATLRARWTLPDAAATPPRPGDRVEVLGWAEPVRAAGQPGGVDYAHVLERAGVAGKLRVSTLKPRPPDATPLRRIEQAWRKGRGAARRAAERSLWLGLADADPDGVALLTRLLLGDGEAVAGSGAGRLDAFRDSGLLHVLSISGAHVGLLLGIGFLVLRVVGLGPRAVAVSLLVLLGLYLCVVPPRVPVLRAAVMAGLVLTPPIFGRRVLGDTVLWLAVLLVLAWDPRELYRPGFHLSFGVVWVIVTFTGPVSRRLAPPPLVPSRDPGWREAVRRRAADVLAVSVVAFSAATLVLAAHGGGVTPWGAFASLLAWPVLSLALTVGMAKLLLGLAVPQAGALLAGPLLGCERLLTGLAQGFAGLPGATLLPPRPLPVLLVAAAAALALAWRAGWHRRRPRLAPLTAAAWPVLALASTAPLLGPGPRVAPGGMELVMLDVGDGSCLLLRTPSHTLMFDCGSQSFPDVGGRVVAPALRWLGIDRVDTLVLSHADLDHFNGLAGLLEAVPVSEVLVPPTFLHAAADDPDDAPALALRLLDEAGLRPQTVAAGDTRRVGDVEARVLWPPTAHRPQRSNNGSLVIRFDAGDASVLLCGDVQERAMTRLLDETPSDLLAADVLELPHHGSAVPASAAWLDAVRPRLTLQSTWRNRLTDDPWPALLGGTPRRVTYHAGMIRVRLDPRPDTPLHVTTWRDDTATQIE